jgi:hypothetical protein
VTPTPSPFSADDLAQLAARGVPLAEAEAQLALLRTPPPPIVLDRPCTVGDGIEQLPPEAMPALLALGDAAAAAGRVTKLVPASGAASRMFKDLIAAHQAPARPSSSAAAAQLFARLDALPFAAELRARSGVAGAPADEAAERAVLRALLDDLGYARLPKGLVPFHHGQPPRTAFEEHLFDAVWYARQADGTCRLHFTVPAEFRDAFVQALAEATPRVVARHPGTRLAVTFSEQHPATDTLAADADGRPFRLAGGALLFRPGGHGALVRNLAALGGDIVILKNVDNVLPDARAEEHARWKRLLVGVLALVQKEVGDLLRACTRAGATRESADRALAYAAGRFARRPARPPATLEEARAAAVEALDRPTRVCGVVRNEGEPGGAPFWVRGRDGGVSVQIVESSQVDAADPAQAAIFRAATHFNPVDVVCGLRSWTGRAFDLDRYVDRDAVFLSRKSHEGRELVALERPGLWNGAMAGWNTICVEVPGSTFAPVKTVFDLLRPEHQG